MEPPLSVLNIDQAIFGYRSGHTLLASSTPIEGAALSDLRRWTDAAEGYDWARGESYLTVRAAPALKKLCVMRTWAAHEMPRPGCVWSHVLLLDSADMARIVDFRGLLSLLHRPQAQLATSHRSLEKLAWRIEADLPGLDEASLVPIIALCAHGGRGEVLCSQAAAELALMAVWSQQWPSLRRSISARVGTVGSLARRSSDIEVEIRTGRGTNDFAYVSTGLAQAARDILIGGGELRQFLWRYGPDWGASRSAFVTLCQVFDLLKRASLNNIDAVLTNALALLAEEPAETESPSLIEHLLAGGAGSKAAIPELDALAMSRWLLAEHRPLGERLLQRLAHLDEGIWFNRTQEVVGLLQLGSEQIEAADLVASLALSAPHPGSLALLQSHSPRVLDTLVGMRPELLIDDFARQMSSRDLARLFKVAPTSDALRLFGDLLVTLDDESLARSAWATAAHLTARHIVAATQRGQLSQCWARVSKPHFDTLLEFGIAKNAERWSDYDHILGIFGWDVADNADPKVLFNFFASAADDLQGEKRLAFMARLLRTAIQNPRPGIEPIFEKVFPEFALALLEDTVSRSVRAPLALDDYYDWSFFYRPPARIRRALALASKVERAYSNLDKQSFARLKNSPLLMLLHQLKSTAPP